jgi:hypothetical protein
VRPEGLYQWKIPMIPSGIEPANRAQCPNQLHHRVPRSYIVLDAVCWWMYWMERKMFRRITVGKSRTSLSSSRNQFRLTHHLLSNYLIYRLHVSVRLGHHRAFTVTLTQIQIFWPLSCQCGELGELLIVFQYISNKMQRYTVYLHLETALHVSGGTSTHHQERIQLI